MADLKQAKEAFKRKFEAEHGKMQPDKLGLFRKEWAAYAKANGVELTRAKKSKKKAKRSKIEQPQPVVVDASKPVNVEEVIPKAEAQAPSFEVAPQSDSMSVPNPVLTTAPTEKPLEEQKKPDAPVVAPQPDGHQLLVDAAVMLLEGSVKLLTKDRVMIFDFEKEMLKQGGVGCMRKYDKDGTISEYAPELAVAGAALSIGLRVAKDMADQKKAKEEKKETPDPLAVDADAYEDSGSVNTGTPKVVTVDTKEGKKTLDLTNHPLRSNL